jgi:3-oxoacyl-[acyl-carrier-protein] synthase-3
VPGQVRQLIKAEGLDLSDVDLFLFHQGSRYMLVQLRRMLGLPEEKVPIEIDQCGNTISSSIPLILEKNLHTANMQSIVISGFGVGLSLASGLLLKHQITGRL